MTQSIEERDEIIVTATIPKPVRDRLKEESDMRGMKFSSFIAELLRKHSERPLVGITPTSRW